MKIRYHILRFDNEKIYFAFATYGKLGMIKTTFVSGDNTYINSFGGQGKVIASYQTLVNDGFEIANSILGSSSLETAMFDTRNSSWWIVEVSRNNGLKYTKVTTATISQVPYFRTYIMYYR